MSSNGKTGIVTSFLGDLRAGTWVYTWNLLRHLADRREIVRIDREERILEGLEGISSQVFPGGGKLAKLTWTNLQLPWGAVRSGFDLVHITTPYGCFRKTRFKKIITICDVTPLLFPESHGRMNVWHHRFMLPEILEQADHIITISEASKSDIIRHYKVPAQKISVTLLAADDKFRSQPGGIPSGFIAGLPRPYILNVGTLEPRKNLIGLLHAFKSACRQGLPHKLVITGARGWGDTPVARIVKELSLEESVVFTGFVADEDLPHLYAGADFFVYPSLYEGFGLPVLEAMACGCPVITSNISSLPEVAGDAALLVDPRSEVELGTAMLALAGDADLRQGLRLRGLDRAACFSWQKTCSETLAVYDSVM